MLFCGCIDVKPQAELVLGLSTPLIGLCRCHATLIEKNIQQVIFCKDFHNKSIQCRPLTAIHRSPLPSYSTPTRELPQNNAACICFDLVHFYLMLEFSEQYTFSLRSDVCVCVLEQLEAKSAACRSERLCQQASFFPEEFCCLKYKTWHKAHPFTSRLRILQHVCAN